MSDEDKTVVLHGPSRLGFENVRILAGATIGVSKEDMDKLKASVADGSTIHFAEAPAPAWTTTPPTEPGCYWVHFVGETALVEVAELFGKLVAYETGSDEPDHLSAYSHFLGPIEPPEPPK